MRRSGADRQRPRDADLTAEHDQKQRQQADERYPAESQLGCQQQVVGRVGAHRRHHPDPGPPADAGPSESRERDQEADRGRADGVEQGRGERARERELDRGALQDVERVLDRREAEPDGSAVHDPVEWFVECAKPPDPDPQREELRELLEGRGQQERVGDFARERGTHRHTQRLSQLRLSSKGIGMVSKMVEHHLRPSTMMQGVEVPTRRAINRYFRDLDEVAIDTLYLCQADFLAAKGPELNPDDWANHARMVAHIVQAGFQPATPEAARQLINGKELIENFKLTPGPLVGLLLQEINEAQAAGEITTTEQAWDLAGQIMSQHQDEG